MPSGIKSLMKSTVLRREEEVGLDSISGKDIFHADKAVEKFLQVYSYQNGGDIKTLMNDPAFSGFRLFFHFDAHHGLLAEETHINSALAYLNRIGDTVRYELLKTFIHTLSTVNSNMPWVFQEVTGLQELYTNPLHAVKLQDKKVSIRCFETVDYSIMSLNMMWRDICFDRHRKVWVLPENLRHFSMSIYIYDMRVFNSRANFLRSGTNQDIAKINHIMFDLGHCEFSVESGSEFFSTVNNSFSEMQYTDLTIDFEESDVSGLFRSITGDQRLDKTMFELAASAVTNVNFAGAFGGIDTPAVEIRPNASGQNSDLFNPDLSALIDPASPPQLEPEENWKTKLKEYARDQFGELQEQGLNRLNNILRDNIARASFELNEQTNGLFRQLTLRAADATGQNLGAILDRPLDPLL